MRIPLDVFHHIFENLERSSDLVRCSLLSRSTSEIAQNILWRQAKLYLHPLGSDDFEIPRARLAHIEELAVVWHQFGTYFSPANAEGMVKLQKLVIFDDGRERDGESDEASIDCVKATLTSLTVNWHYNTASKLDQNTMKLWRILGKLYNLQHLELYTSEFAIVGNHPISFSLKSLQINHAMLDREVMLRLTENSKSSLRSLSVPIVTYSRTATSEAWWSKFSHLTHLSIGVEFTGSALPSGRAMDNFLSHLEWLSKLETLEISLSDEDGLHTPGAEIDQIFNKLPKLIREFTLTVTELDTPIMITRGIKNLQPEHALRLLSLTFDEDFFEDGFEEKYEELVRVCESRNIEVERDGM